MTSHAEIMRLFRYADKNGDGVMDKDEMFALFKLLGMPDNLNEELFRNADRDGDGKIQVEEFLKFIFDLDDEGKGQAAAALKESEKQVGDQKENQKTEKEELQYPADWDVKVQFLE